MPYAITSDAIDHFRGRFQEWEFAPEPGVSSASLYYDAHIHYGWKPPGKQSTPVPAAVQMHLEFWLHTDADIVLLTLDRIVTFDEDGEVLGVYGDGDIQLPEIAT